MLIQLVLNPKLLKKSRSKFVLKVTLLCFKKCNKDALQGMGGLGGGGLVGLLSPNEAFIITFEALQFDMKKNRTHFVLFRKYFRNILKTDDSLVSVGKYFRQNFFSQLKYG